MLSLKDGESHSQAQNVRWDENIVIKGAPCYRGSPKEYRIRKLLFNELQCIIYTPAKKQRNKNFIFV